MDPDPGHHVLYGVVGNAGGPVKSLQQIMRSRVSYTLRALGPSPRSSCREAAMHRYSLVRMLSFTCAIATMLRVFQQSVKIVP